MRYCSNCGTQNDNDARFCSACGAQLEAAPAENVAPATEEAAPAPAPAPIPTPAPAPEYQAPPQGYQAPPQGYQAPPQGYQAPQQDYVPYGEEVPAPSAKCRTFGIIGFILGVSSTAFCWLGIIPAGGIVAGFFMVAFAVVGLIFCNISIKEGEFKLARVGRVFSIIGICLAAVCWIIGIIITAAAVGSGNYYINY